MSAFAEWTARRTTTETATAIAQRVSSRPCAKAFVLLGRRARVVGRGVPGWAGGVLPSWSDLSEYLVAGIGPVQIDLVGCHSRSSRRIRRPGHAPATGLPRRASATPSGICTRRGRVLIIGLALSP